MIHVPGGAAPPPSIQLAAPSPLALILLDRASTAPWQDGLAISLPFEPAGAYKTPPALGEQTESKRSTSPKVRRRLPA
jgi:hypothetical protein